MGRHTDPKDREWTLERIITLAGSVAFLVFWVLVSALVFASFVMRS